MKEQEQSGLHDCRRMKESAVLSRRQVVSSSSLAFLGLLPGPVFGQEKPEPGRKGPDVGSSKRAREQTEDLRAFAERMRDASPEERMKIMEERRVSERQRAIEDLKGQLRVSDQEWGVIKPRIEKVYNLVHPLPQMGGGNNQKRSEVEERGRELRELLREEGAAAEQIKARLTALRAAKEKVTQELAAARQSLRQILSLRQEAVLVLNGLLD